MLSTSASSRSSSSVMTRLCGCFSRPGLFAIARRVKGSVALELASISALQRLGFNIVFGAKLSSDSPGSITSARNEKCTMRMITGIGNLPLLDRVSVNDVIGKKLHSFYDDSTFDAGRDMGIIVSSYRHCGDRLTPQVELMSEVMSRADGLGDRLTSPYKSIMIEDKPATEQAKVGVGIDGLGDDDHGGIGLGDGSYGAHEIVRTRRIRRVRPHETASASRSISWVAPRVPHLLRPHDNGMSGDSRHADHVRRRLRDRRTSAPASLDTIS